MHPTVKEMHKFALIKATIFLKQEQMIMSVDVWNNAINISATFLNSWQLVS